MPSIQPSKPETEDLISRSASLRDNCFGAETLVYIRLDETTWPLMKSDVDVSIYDINPPLGFPILVEIQYLKPGVEVLSRCEETGEMGFKRITHCIEDWQHGYHGLYCEDQYGGRDFISVTRNHPFWVLGKGWTKARDLEIEDRFLTHDGGKVVLKSKHYWDNETYVYNLTVEDFHTYFVGAGGIWVHNTKGTDIEVHPVVPEDSNAQFTSKGPKGSDSEQRSRPQLTPQRLRAEMQHP